MSRTALFSRNQPGGLFSVEDVVEHPGNIFFVDSGCATGADSVGAGQSPDVPFLTLDYAVGQCTANNGDVIYVMPGHSENLSATTLVALDVAGVSVIGLGNGLDRPQFTVTANVDGMSITADNVTLENLYFNEGTAAHTSNINIAAAHATLRKIHTDAGVREIDAITVAAAGELATFEDCTYVVTANGPDDWILFEGAVDLPVIRRNYLVGCDGTNPVDDGIINFDTVAVTNPIVVDNTFDGADQATTAIANVGAVVGDCFTDNRYAGLATDADTVTTYTAALADDGITAAKIAANAIGASEIANGAIDAATFAAGAIDAAAIATNAIDADALAADAVAEIADGVLDEALTSHLTNYTVGQALASTEMCVEKSDGAVLLGDDPIFTISGGPIHILELTGIVTTIIGAGATNVKLELDTTEPAATVQMNAGAVDIDTDAAGTSYRTINTTGVFTPVTAGFVLQANSFATNPTEYLSPIGTIMFNSDAARNGNIKWYLRYKPLSPNSKVVAAA